MKEFKKVIAGLGCKDSKAVALDGKQEVFETDILTLCRALSDNGADEIFIRDLSENDSEHEKVIGTIKEIAKISDAALIAGGRVKRLEDIKKYLYAGAKAVFLDTSSDENVDLIKEAADRFGTEKVYALISDKKKLGSMEEYDQLGASMMIITEDIDNLSECNYPVIAFCENSLDKEASALSKNFIKGIIISARPETNLNCMEIKHQLRNKDIQTDTFESAVEWKDFKINSDGMIPVVVQDYKTLEVLMVAYMNEEAFNNTLKTGKMTYYSRSRNELWLKGETSGHLQYVKSLSIDCDNDTILAKVAQVGAACHTGAHSCFFTTLAEKDYKETNPLKVFEDVYGIILDRKANPKEGSYTNYLFDKGIDKILKKVGEEATEIIIAAKNPDPEEIKYEISDFLYHMMVLMADKGISWENITQELANR